MNPYEKLALTDEQKKVFAEFEKAYKNCRKAGIAFVQTNYHMYVINNQDVYDFNCLYDDYSCSEINVEFLQKCPLATYSVCPEEKEDCRVSFYSTTFTAKGITH